MTNITPARDLEAWMITWNGNATDNIFLHQQDAELELKRLNSLYPQDSRSLIRLCQPAAPVQEPVAQWRNAAIAAYPNSDPDQWPDSFKVRFMKQEIAQLRATPPAPAPAPAPVPLTDDQIDAATKAWFENDIVAGRNPFRKRMRAAFAAAHGITEKGGAA
jgi:hypothetical protein